LPLQRYKRMIQINANKGKNKAIKTMISFV